MTGIRRLPSFFAVALIAGFLSLVGNLGVEAQEKPRPNILLILADDLGVEGLGCYGGVSYKTPNLDKLAAGGLRFTHAYAQPLCTNTRVQLMTGKYNHRNWKYFGILDPKEETFGHAMQKAGYRTCMAGKWQLTSYDPPDYPGAEARRNTGMKVEDAGFDAYSLWHVGHTEDKGSRYADPVIYQDGTFMEGTEGGYGEDYWVDFIQRFMDTHREEPKFVYYSMALPHWPMVPTPISEDWKDPSKRHAEDAAYFPDMVEYMDTVIGRLLEGLEAAGHLENTLVIYYADNGTDRRITSRLADGTVVEGGKGLTSDAGVHVPLIASWPGHVPMGETTDTLVDSSDFFPTLLEVAGAKPGAERELDGLSFLPQLLGQKNPKERESVFFWYDPRPGWDKDQFSRHIFAQDRRYKLYSDGKFYNLEADILEEHPIGKGKMTAEEEAARDALYKVIEDTLAGPKSPWLETVR